MREITDRAFFLGGALLALLAGGLLFLPLGLVLVYVLLQRRRELRKGELIDAQKY